MFKVQLLIFLLYCLQHIISSELYLDTPSFDHVCAKTTTASCVLSLQPHHWLHYVPHEVIPGREPGNDWIRSLNFMDGCS